MEFFQGKIKNHGNDTSHNDTADKFCGAPQLNGSVFYESNYCNLNFNDVLSSVLVLSTVLFENNWHSILFTRILNSICVNCTWTERLTSSITLNKMSEYTVCHLVDNKSNASLLNGRSNSKYQIQKVSEIKTNSWQWRSISYKNESNALKRFVTLLKSSLFEVRLRWGCCFRVVTACTEQDNEYSITLTCAPVLTEGFELVSGWGARVYFAVFFMCVSVVVMK